MAHNSNGAALMRETKASGASLKALDGRGERASSYSPTRSLFRRREFLDLLVSERLFLGLLGFALFVVGATFRIPEVARWVGFFLAAYAVIANDSIQTIGTFLASNRQQKWWVLWLFLGSIFLLTATYSYLNYGSDVTYGRLGAKGFETTPTQFQFLQIAAPLFLLILTRMRTPVSTTFLILSSFATSGGSVVKVLTKSLSGYFVAFATAIVVWRIVTPLTLKGRENHAHPGWRVAQWVSSGFLWSVWLMQDAANIAVYLPRQLSVTDFAAFNLIILAVLGVLMFRRGGRIQTIVDAKTDVTDVRSATIIDIIYGIILYIFKIQSKIPMSTTWVFLGLLAGREFALRFASHPETSTNGSVLKMAGQDLARAGFGLIVSLLLAASINPDLLSSLFHLF